MKQYGLGSRRTFWATPLRPPSQPRDTNVVESLIGKARNMVASFSIKKRKGVVDFALGIQFLQAFCSLKGWQSSTKHYTNKTGWTGLGEALSESETVNLWNRGRNLAEMFKNGSGFFINSGHPGVFVFPKRKKGGPSLFELLGERDENVEAFCRSDVIFKILCGIRGQPFTLEQIIQEISGLRERKVPPFFFNNMTTWELLQDYEEKAKNDSLKYALDIIDCHEALGETFDFGKTFDSTERLFQEACALALITAKYLFRVVHNEKMRNNPEWTRPLAGRASARYQCSCIGYSKKVVCEHVLAVEIQQHDSHHTIESNANPSLVDFGSKVSRAKETERSGVWTANSSSRAYCGNVVMRFSEGKAKRKTQQDHQRYWGRIGGEAGQFVGNLVSLLSPGKTSRNETLRPTQRVEWERLFSYFDPDSELQGLVPERVHNKRVNAGKEIGATAWAFEFIPRDEHDTTRSKTRRGKRIKSGSVLLDGVEFISYSWEDRSWVITGANGPRANGDRSARVVASKFSSIEYEPSLLEKGVFGISSEYGWVVRLPENPSKEGKNKITVQTAPNADRNASHKVDRNTFLPFCTVASLALEKRGEADALILPMSHNQATVSDDIYTPTQRYQLEVHVGDSHGVLCLYWPLDAYGKNNPLQSGHFWLNYTTITFGLKAILTQHAQAANSVYVAELSKRYDREMAYINFQAKADAGVEHILVPAHVGQNHFVLFWISRLRTEHPCILFLDSIGANHRSAKALSGDSADVMRELMVLLPKAQVGILPCPQQHEFPFMHCGLYMLYNLDCILKAHTKQPFKQNLESLPNKDSNPTHTMNRTLKDLSKCIFLEFEQSAWTLDKFPPISNDSLSQLRSRFIREIESLYVDYAQRTL